MDIRQMMKEAEKAVPVTEVAFERVELHSGPAEEKYYQALRDKLPVAKRPALDADYQFFLQTDEMLLNLCQIASQYVTGDASLIGPVVSRYLRCHKHISGWRICPFCNGSGSDREIHFCPCCKGAGYLA